MGRRKQDFQFGPYRGLTASEHKILNVLFVWKHTIRKATAYTISIKTDLALNHVFLCLRGLLEKEMIGKSVKGSYFLPPEVKNGIESKLLGG